MTTEAYDDHTHSGRSFWGWIATIITTITAVGSITSLGSSLFSGLEFINWIIDTWHSIFAPAVTWLNEYLFAWWDIEISQMQIDVLAIWALFFRILTTSLQHIIPSLALRALISFSGFTAIFYSYVFDAAPMGVTGLATMKSGDLRQLIGLAVIFALWLLPKLFRHNNSAKLVSTVFAGFLVVNILAYVIELNAHADENLPYVERWLTAWDDIFVEE